MKEPIKTDKELLSYCGFFINQFRHLQKLSRQIHKIDENDCNGYKDFNGNWDEKASIKADRRRAKLLKKADTIAEEVGFKIYHQSDCRGCSLYLITCEDILKGSNYNYTDGIAVY